MDLNLLEIETGRTNKTIKILIILIILVFIIIIGVFTMMFFNYKGIEIAIFSKNKNETIQTSTAEVNDNINNEIDNNNDIPEQNQNNNLPNMNEETIKKIKNIYKEGSSDNKVAYLTFDDGPSKKITPHVLDILKENDIKATFFVLGTNVGYNPQVLKRAYEEGHYIANHGYSHEYSKIYDKKENVLEEYNKTEQAIREAIGVENYSSGLFRFPGGSAGGKYADIKNEAKKLLEENNVAYLDWNALTSDAVAGTSKDELIRSLKETVKGKDSVVILMHDAGNKKDTLETLPEVIGYLREEGYQFKNIYDFMK